MNQLMNIYEVNEPVLGVWGLEKKYALFFFLNMAFWRILGSLMFICFINFDMRSTIGEFVRQVTRINIHLMNLMNIYEVRLFKRFFEKVALVGKDLMNMKMHLTSLRFINLEA